MYAFYSLLIYIFYSLFRRDGGAAAAADPGDPAQVTGAGRAACRLRRPPYPHAEVPRGGGGGGRGARGRAKDPRLRSCAASADLDPDPLARFAEGRARRLPSASSARARKSRGHRRPDLPAPELWTELTGLAGTSESEDGSEGGAEGRAAAVSLEEALLRLAEFLSVQLGAEESCGSPADLGQVSAARGLRAPAVCAGLPGPHSPAPILVSSAVRRGAPTVDSDQPTLGPSGMASEPQGEAGPAPGDSASFSGSTSQEESPSRLGAVPGEPPGDEAQGQQSLQLEEDHRAWQRLEQLILGQLEELKQQLEQQEEELGRLRLGVGATDSEKRVQHLTLENEALKQSLSLTRDLLLHWGPGPPTRASQEEAEALVELQGRLQEAQDTTEALRAQLGVQEVQLQGLQGALQQLQQETEQNCRRELQQMHGQLAGLRARMASLRQGCGDLRGLVSTFTQSCQGSLSEARGQVRCPGPWGHCHLEGLALSSLRGSKGPQPDAQDGFQSSKEISVCYVA
ncbi:Kinesin-like protein kifc2 [Saguinus oedipus]|uniref:Kinesin-like protein kifc2 n=1 Tax=Saguinus oedipus TaxID=9490 RepID=A0ABQ9UDZ2_SAGOE|nr:Kinesin-like protein kifc2 [Saguinus oedipus]